jgi:hypothetical protein
LEGVTLLTPRSGVGQYLEAARACRPADVKDVVEGVTPLPLEPADGLTMGSEGMRCSESAQHSFARQVQKRS